MLGVRLSLLLVQRIRLGLLVGLLLFRFLQECLRLWPFVSSFVRQVCCLWSYRNRTCRLCQLIAPLYTYELKTYVRAIEQVVSL